MPSYKNKDEISKIDLTFFKRDLCLFLNKVFHLKAILFFAAALLFTRLIFYKFSTFIFRYMNIPRQPGLEVFKNVLQVKHTQQ